MPSRVGEGQDEGGVTALVLRRLSIAEILGNLWRKLLFLLQSVEPFKLSVFTKSTAFSHSRISLQNTGMLE